VVVGRKPTPKTPPRSTWIDREVDHVLDSITSYCYNDSGMTV